MSAAPLRSNETQSLEALRGLDVLDSGPEAEFQALVAVASAVCGVPVSLISLIDAERQWFKANVGLPGVTETPRESAFCAHAVLGDDLFEVPDATVDERFADNPLVTGQPDIRFYAGMPVLVDQGFRVGTICVIDRQPRCLDAMQREVLKQLAVAAGHALESRAVARRTRDIARELANREQVLRETARTLGEAQRLGHIGSWEWDVVHDVTVWSEELYRIAGFDPTQPLPSLDERFALFAPDGQRRLRRAIDECRRTGGSYVIEAEFSRGDSAQRCWMETRGTAVLNEAGQVVAVRGTAQDITSRKKDEQALRRSQQFLERTGVLAGVGGWEVNLVSGEVFWSSAVCQIHGVEPGHQPTLEEAIAYYEPRSRIVVEAAVQEAIRSGKGFDLELELVRSDGALRAVRTIGSVDRVDGTAVSLFGAFQDVTERQRLARELAEQHELLRVTLQSIGDAVITTDATGLVTWLNPVAESLTGWLNSEASGRPVRQVFNIIHEETREPAPDPVAACLVEEQVVGLAHRSVLISLEGSERGIEDSAAPIWSAGGELVGVVLVFRDVSEQRRLSREMTYRATHDALTGLVNRTEFETRLQRTLDSAHEEHSEHVLLYIDLDQFKLVNDACGHAVGDKLLQQVSRLLEDAIRSRDTLARLGGDEFAIILGHCTAAQAQRVAQSICDRMDVFRFLHDDRRFRIGTSIGLVPLDSRWSNTEEIKQAADASCYAAKEAGRNRYHAWFDTDAAMRARHGEMEWTSRIERALDNNEFVLYAQKIQCLQEDCAGLRAEVLLRLKDVDGRLVPPGAFLPAAERFHLATRIDKWVLQRAVSWLKALPASSVLAGLSVNLSGQSVGDRAFHNWAFALLDEAGPTIRSQLCLEITETAAVTKMSDAALFVEHLRASGVRVALDDFGAGASSFGYLKNLPVDYLKIDGQFVRDLITDPLNEAAVRCFVDVAKVMGLQTVAEFVDHPAVMARLSELGVDYAQGFLVHRPASIDDLLVAMVEQQH
ncbi:EAL domain-containing protein [Paucibacter sp. R3-3]|uniref:EAL domain-containing protein n=1 Tax=Roseateles agri TaxID=3098619 RepID=A0ABU5DNU3_9BURK|nr:EAL domain-containing protein [Paucibacter sp. R3-3]MDY0747345.1 EAL domain-containing protein [Paucibacter sp. R3-3]